MLPLCQALNFYSRDDYYCLKNLGNGKSCELLTDAIYY